MTESDSDHGESDSEERPLTLEQRMLAQVMAEERAAAVTAAAATA